MSVNGQDPGAAPIIPGSPLARVLDGYAVPELADGFAERVLAAAEARPAPLPGLRPPARSQWRRWRAGQRIAIGLASFGALATAAAATGLLQQLALPVPSAQTVWASLTGTAAAENIVPARPAATAPAAANSDAAGVAIDGPIDTPEELGEAFRRVEQVRSERRAERRTLIDQRIRNEIERRRAAGLPVPTAEEEARLRGRIEQELARREERADQQIAARREAMQRKIENGEALTPADLAGRPPLDPALRDKMRELRAMTPAERREAWRSLPPAERRVIAETLRARRATATAAQVEAAPEPLPAE